MNLYSNENFPLPVVRFLRELGHDVLTSKDANNAGLGIPDEAVLAFAIQEKRALLTVNRKDFIKIHREQPIHFGIIICTENDNFHDFAAKIDRKMKENEDFLENQIIKVFKG